MLTYNRIKMLCKEKGVTVTGTEKEVLYVKSIQINPVWKKSKNWQITLMFL